MTLHIHIQKSVVLSHLERSQVVMSVSINHHGSVLGPAVLVGRQAVTECRHGRQQTHLVDEGNQDHRLPVLQTTPKSNNKLSNGTLAK